MSKKQDAKLFLEKASANQDNRPVLCFVNKTENFSGSADGYRAHYVLVDLPEYQLGLNHTKYSTKKGMVLDGRFPDMQAIKNSRPKIMEKIVLSKDTIEEIIKAIKIAMVFARDSANSIRICANGRMMKITGKSAERGDAETTVMLDNPVYFEVSSNGHYFLDALKGFSHDSVTLYVEATGNEPIHFESNERYAIVMPMSR